MINEPTSSRPRRDSIARAPAAPRPMPVTGPGNGPTELPPSKRRAPTGRPSRRKLDRKAPRPRVPAKAKEAVGKLLDEIRAKAVQRPPSAKAETERKTETRDAN